MEVPIELTLSGNIDSFGGGKTNKHEDKRTPQQHIYKIPSGPSEPLYNPSGPPELLLLISLLGSTSP
jgi:hypothetical protein